MKELNNTAHQILDIAELYTQTRGFNAFSYKDIQNEIGIKTSSIHYYFPSKQDLAKSMTERYINRYQAVLDDINQKQSESIERLKALTAAFMSTLKQGKFCVCGMLSSDLIALPETVSEQLTHFFNLNESWISDNIKLGQQQKSIHQSINSKNMAALFIAALEGGMLIARSQNRPEYLETVITEVLSQLKK